MVYGQDHSTEFFASAESRSRENSKLEETLSAPKIFDEAGRPASVAESQRRVCYGPSSRSLAQPGTVRAPPVASGAGVAADFDRDVKWARLSGSSFLWVLATL